METVAINPLLPSDLSVSIDVILGIRTREKSAHNKSVAIPQIKAPTVEEARKKGQLILLAEDNSTNREVIKRQLNRLGYAVELAHHGLQALDKYKRGTYGLLLTDCHMPHMDGFQLTEAVRNYEQSEKISNKIPIVAITANAIRGEAERCYEKGMNDFLSKPVELENMKQVLGKWLPIDLHKCETIDDGKIEVTEAEIDQASIENTALNEELKGSLNTSQLVSLVGDDLEIIISLLQDYQESSRDINEEIKKAWNKQDLLQVGKLGHKLKSAARTVGAPRLGDICELLQNAGKENNESLVAETLPKFTDEYALIRSEISNYIESLDKKLVSIAL